MSDKVINIPGRPKKHLKKEIFLNILSYSKKLTTVKEKIMNENEKYLTSLEKTIAYAYKIGDKDECFIKHIGQL